MEHLHELAVFIAVGVLGAFAHWFKKWFRNEITGNLFDYLFRDQPKSTGLALFTLVGLAGAAWLAGELDALDLRALIKIAFLAGYTVDSAVNKAAAP